ncbi:MAG TPA: hypothetical protein PKZ19_17385 [Zoogloea sp.]|nr:hypothetical protein [Zoogloea sp.]
MQENSWRRCSPRPAAAPTPRPKTRPRPLAGQPWWLVCRVEHGSLQWYAEVHCPDFFDAAYHCRGSGPWLPLDTPAPAPWLHLQAGVLDPED